MMARGSGAAKPVVVPPPAPQPVALGRLVPAPGIQTAVAAAATAAAASPRNAARGIGPRFRRWRPLIPLAPSVTSVVVAQCSKDSDGAALWSLNSSRVQVLAALTAIFVANQAVRALPFYLVDFGPSADPATAMNTALGFGSAEYGFFATVGFTVPFTLASLAAGLVADSTDRLRLCAFAGIAWSLVTMGMSAAGSFDVLLGERALLGLAQAATNPAALPLIAELFPEARATASSIFGLGVYLGGGIASLGAALDERVGWRNTCAAFGAVSLLVSLLAFTAADPRKDEARDQSDASRSGGHDKKAPVLEQLQDAVASLPSATEGFVGKFVEATSPEPARWLLLASALRFCAGFAILVWLPPAVRGLYPESVESFAVVNSLIKAFAGGVSSLAGGLAADALRARGFGDRAGAAFCAVGSLAAAPLWYYVLAEGLSFEASMAFLLAEYLIAESWLGPAIATLQSAVPANRRGAAQGIFSSLTALGNALPAALGLLAPQDLAAGLQYSVSGCYLLSAGCFLAAFASSAAPARGEPE